VEQPATAPLRDLWRGISEDDYGTCAVQGTTALALTLLQPGLNSGEAGSLAQSLWQQRDTTRLD
jgi:TctA family transporter